MKIDATPFLTPAKLEELAERVCGGQGLERDDALNLIQFVFALTGSGLTCWQPVPIETGVWVLVSNGESITPPMRFSDETEAGFFTKCNDSKYYLPIPTPPEFKL